MIAPFHRKPIVKTRSYLEAEARRARDYADALAATDASAGDVARWRAYADRLDRNLEEMDKNGK